MPDDLDWNVAIYCANEEKRLERCIGSVLAALSGRRVIVTVILNGSSDRSVDKAISAARAGAPIEIFKIEIGDKSNAINQFFYSLRSRARAYGEVDGYAYVGETSFRAMEDRFAADPRAVAVTGVCTNGRTMKLATAETLAVGGRLHGQLHAFRWEFLDRLVARGIKVPLGTYWGDGLLGSMAAHDLDAVSEPWDNRRIAGVAEATYEIPRASLLSIDDLRRHFRRKKRQMRGRIQTAAFKSIIYRDGYEALPDDADVMIRDYLAENAAPPVSWPDRVFQRLAIGEIRQRPAYDPAALVPQRIATT
jgi:hypothetical protein